MDSMYWSEVAGFVQTHLEPPPDPAQAYQTETELAALSYPGSEVDQTEMKSVALDHVQWPQTMEYSVASQNHYPGQSVLQTTTESPASAQNADHALFALAERIPATRIEVCQDWRIGKTASSSSDALLSQ